MRHHANTAKSANMAPTCATHAGRSGRQPSATLPVSLQPSHLTRKLLRETSQKGGNGTALGCSTSCDPNSVIQTLSPAINYNLNQPQADREDPDTLEDPPTEAEPPSLTVPADQSGNESIPKASGPAPSAETRLHATRTQSENAGTVSRVEELDEPALSPTQTYGGATLPERWTAIPRSRSPRRPQQESARKLAKNTSKECHRSH